MNVKVKYPKLSLNEVSIKVNLPIDRARHLFQDLSKQWKSPKLNFVDDNGETYEFDPWEA